MGGAWIPPSPRGTESFWGHLSALCLIRETWARIGTWDPYPYFMGKKWCTAGVPIKTSEFASKCVPNRWVWWFTIARTPVARSAPNIRFRRAIYKKWGLWKFSTCETNEPPGPFWQSRRASRLVCSGTQRYCTWTPVLSHLKNFKVLKNNEKSNTCEKVFKIQKCVKNATNVIIKLDKIS